MPKSRTLDQNAKFDPERKVCARAKLFSQFPGTTFSLKREGSEFATLCSHVSRNFVFANLNRTARALDSFLADLGSAPVDVLAPTFFCFLVP